VSFARPGRVFLTVTLGLQGVAVFVNGVAARLPPRISVPGSEIGSGLVFGDSPGQGDNWEGDIFGLAVYPRQLTPTQVWHDYAVWTTGTPDVPMIQSASGFYLFDEHDGALVRDRSGSGPDHPRFRNDGHNYQHSGGVGSASSCMSASFASALSFARLQTSLGLEARRAVH
jgi:hypothetical protein